jgi:predicted dehydrogenase
VGPVFSSLTQKGDRVSETADLGAVVVGTSIGVLLHVPGLRDGGIRVEALVGRDHDKATKRAELLGVPHACASLEEALALPGVDLVVVATPPSAHVALVEEAVAAGKHVLCEKPFGLDLAQARGMYEAAEKAGVVHVLGTEFGFDSAQALLRRVVLAEEVGTPRFVMLVLHMGALTDLSAEVPAWFDDAAQGGGWLRGAVPHPIDLVRSTLGEFASVAGSVQRLGPRPGVTSDDTVTMTFTLESGVEGVMQSSTGAYGPPLLVTKIIGSNGAAWIDPMTRTVWVDQGSGPREVPFPADLVSPPPVPPAAELITTTYDTWHATGNEAITSGRMYKAVRERILGEERSSPEVLATFADGVAIQAIIQAMVTASDEHRTVNIREFDQS